MPNEPQLSQQQLYSQIDVTHQSSSPNNTAAAIGDLGILLREMISAQDRQNELLEELVGQMNAAQRQKATELGMWKQSHPELARDCRSAAEALTHIQTEYLTMLTEEINENYETLRDGEFMLNEFIDRFGPRMAHMNGILQVLAQLGGPTMKPNPPKAR